MWRAANDGTGSRRWFVTHDDESLPVSERYLHGKGDRLIRFESYEAAKKAADRLNGTV